ncbi:Capsule synthesis protein [Carbonactinospora thermoautotrophica]|uniref:Capsule synthesis protein n=1 Tax=Carbonactinospora thermoautotrophica TaxID=1469144 RepID=A0A132MZV5_9ACTN|nr:Capsule synthesis protein [Carbonactinospora thermoautotrophica]
MPPDRTGHRTLRARRCGPGTSPYRGVESPVSPVRPSAASTAPPAAATGGPRSGIR